MIGELISFFGCYLICNLDNDDKINFQLLLVENSGSNNITAENCHFVLGWCSAGAREVNSKSVITPRARMIIQALTC